MNKIIFLLFFSTISMKAQVVFEKSLVEAFEKAKTQNKNIFIEYYNSECSVCKKLGNLLKTDTIVASYYNKRFINYALNTNKELSKEESRLLESANLHFESVPVLLYFDKNGSFLHHSGANLNAESIVNEGKRALSPNDRTASLPVKYENGDRTVRTLYAYCDLLLLNKNEHLLKRVSQELFESFKKEELPTKKSYIVLKQVVISYENGFFQYWINHIDDLKDFETGSKIGTEKLALERIVLKELSDSAIKKWNSQKVEDFKIYIKILKLSDNPNIYFE